FRYLQVGDWIRVVGSQSIDRETGEPKLKAKEVVRVKPLELVTTPLVTAPSPAVATTQPKKRKASKILICQKSSCRKRGAMQVCDAVETALADQGLAETVQVKLTGCMDKCKAGPHVVVMPHKQRHTKVKPKQVPGLIAQNFQHDEVG
ncbi:MAG: (2Fe-2S) ferredoxin domain-containing protein, partial [Cyanobacteria bacterium P01_D01_bin.2]